MSEHPGGPAAVRLGGQGAGLAPPTQEPGDERDTDAEQPSDLPLRPQAVVHRRGDPLAQVHRIGTHGCALLIRCRLVPDHKSLYIHYIKLPLRYAKANRLSQDHR